MKGFIMGAIKRALLEKKFDDFDPEESYDIISHDSQDTYDADYYIEEEEIMRLEDKKMAFINSPEKRKKGIIVYAC